MGESVHLSTFKSFLHAIVNQNEYCSFFITYFPPMMNYETY